jgi:hypothetical protein
MRSCAPTASPRPGQRLIVDGLACPTACAFRFSRPLDAFIRPEPGGLVSCHIRSWGCALQSFAPPVQPYAVSGAAPLLSLRHTRWPLHRAPASGRRSDHQWVPGMRNDPGSAPRLQGFAPHESPLPPPRLLHRHRGRSSPGLRALQGSLPRWSGPAFAVPPLMGLPRSGANDRPTGPSGSRFQRDWLVSLETADPPGLWRLVTITNV